MDDPHLGKFAEAGNAQPGLMTIDPASWLSTPSSGKFLLLLPLRFLFLFLLFSFILLFNRLFLFLLFWRLILLLP